MIEVLLLYIFLYVASYRGYEAIVRLLLKYGADPCLQGGEKRLLAIDMARSSDIKTLLSAYECDLNDKNEN